MKQELSAVNEKEFDDFLTDRADGLAGKFLMVRFKEYNDNEALFNDDVKNEIINEIGKKYGCLIGESAINLYYPTLREFIATEESEEMRKQNLAKLTRAENGRKLCATFVGIFKALYQIVLLLFKIIMGIFALFALAIMFVCQIGGKPEKKRRY